MPGADLQLETPKQGRFSAVLTAGGPSQLHAAVALLCQCGRQQPDPPPVDVHGQVDYRQRPYAAIHFIELTKTPLATGHPGSIDSLPVSQVPGEDNQQPLDGHGSGHQPQAGSGVQQFQDGVQLQSCPDNDGRHRLGPDHDSSHQSPDWRGGRDTQDRYHMQKQGRQGPYAAHGSIQQDHHPLQHQQQLPQRSPGGGWGMQPPGFPQTSQAGVGAHSPHMGGCSPAMGGQVHPQWGASMQQGQPRMGMGWGMQPPPNPHAWRQGGPIPFSNFAADDLLGGPHPGSATLLQKPPDQQNIHSGQHATTMQGQWHQGNGSNTQGGRAGNGHAGTAPTPISAQASHGMHRSRRLQGQRQGHHSQDAAAYSPMPANAMGQPWPSGSLLPGNLAGNLPQLGAHQQMNGMHMQPAWAGDLHPGNLAAAGYSHQQPHGMQEQMQVGNQSRDAQLKPGSAAVAGQSKKHWKKPKAGGPAQQSAAGSQDQSQERSGRQVKKQRPEPSEQGDEEVRIEDQEQLPKKLSKKQKRREREAMPDYDMVRWLETGLLPAWWTSERGSPTRHQQLPADFQLTAHGDGLGSTPEDMHAPVFGDGLSRITDEAAVGTAEGAQQEELGSPAEISHPPGYEDGMTHVAAAAEQAVGAQEAPPGNAACDTQIPGLGDGDGAAEQGHRQAADVMPAGDALSHGREGLSGQQDLQAGGQGGGEVLAGMEVPYRDECPPDQPIDLRPLLLFDLNGTLTAHTSVRKGSGRSETRPGLHHLRRLQVCEIASVSC